MGIYGRTISRAINEAPGPRSPHEQVEADLAWGAKWQRDAWTYMETIIGDAVRAGIPAARIHELTGVPPTRIAQLGQQDEGSVVTVPVHRDPPGSTYRSIDEGGTDGRGDAGAAGQ